MKALGKGSVASIVRIGLTVAWWVLWVASAFWALALVSYLVFLALVGLGAIDPATIPPMNRGESGGVQFQMSGVDAAGLRGLSWTDWQIFVPALLAGAVTLGGSLVIVGRLRRLFDSFTSAEPFRRENAQHLRVIWITMLAIELSRYALLALMALFLGVFGKPEFAESITLSVDSENFSSWMSILILIVLAEVFREGSRMKEEQELTI